MKRLLITIVGALVLGATVPALAGPDFQLLERARKAKQAEQAEHPTDVRVVQGPAGAESLKCPPEPLVLPLDHGLRAQTTPGENRWRKARYDAQLKACQEAIK